MFKGSFPAPLFYYVGAPCAISSLVLIYYISQYLHHDAPFPHRTISQVAQHYPEFLIFRMSTVTGSVLIALGWMTNYFFLKTVCKESGINLSSYHALAPLTAGVSAGCLLMGSTAAIDTGHMNGTFHGICATSFFILTFFAQIYNTVVVALLSQKTKLISVCNLYVKYGILILLALQFIYSAEGGFDLEDIVSLGDDKSNFLEWTMTVTIIGMFLSIGADVSGYEFVDVEDRGEQIDA